MKALDSAKNFAKEFFSQYDPTTRVLIKVTVYTHSIAYRPNDIGEPRHMVDFLVSDPKMIEKYGLHIRVESKQYYFNTHTGDTLTLWFEENPDYDGKHTEERLRLAQEVR